MSLPNFIIAGAPKAGTHSLYDYMRKHPQVFMPTIKEPRYFAFNGRKDRMKYPIETFEEYQTLFADAPPEKHAIGEASSIYFANPKAAERIREVLPDVKLIFTLREPVQRTFSIYHMNLRMRGTNEGKSFLEALAVDPMLQRKYYDCLKPFVDAFPREQIKIVMFEDLSKQTSKAVRSIYEYIGVDSTFIPDLSISNPGGVPRFKLLHRLISGYRVRHIARQVLPNTLREQLKLLRNKNLVRERMIMTQEERDAAYAFFEEDTYKAQDLLGIDLSHWLKPKVEEAWDKNMA